jgi:hypothetical protein
VPNDANTYVPETKKDIRRRRIRTATVYLVTSVYGAYNKAVSRSDTCCMVVALVTYIMNSEGTLNYLGSSVLHVNNNAVYI